MCAWVSRGMGWLYGMQESSVHTSVPTNPKMLVHFHKVQSLGNANTWQFQETIERSIWQSSRELLDLILHAHVLRQSLSQKKSYRLLLSSLQNSCSPSITALHPPTWLAIRSQNYNPASRASLFCSLQTPWAPPPSAPKSQQIHSLMLAS